MLRRRAVSRSGSRVIIAVLVSVLFSPDFAVAGAQTELGDQSNRCAASGAREVFLSGYLPVDGVKPVTTAPFFGAKGEELSIQNWRGRPLLLNVWATWCPPCVKELPALARLRLHYKSKGVPIDVVAVNVDKASTGEVQKFLRKVGAADLEAIVDPDRSFMKAARIGSLPVTLLVNAQGQEIAAVLRDATWDDPEVAGFIENCLNPAAK